MTPAKYRAALPQTGDGLFMSDGGLETTLIFHEQVVLRDFAAFELLDSEDGRARLDAYFRTYAEIARTYGLGMVLDTVTWRANADWGSKLGHDAQGLDRFNRAAVDMLLDLRQEVEQEGRPLVISGAIGPRGDGYSAERRMIPDDAARYHAAQIATFAEAGADMVAALTLNYTDEAIGLVRAARTCEMPIAISFTVETDGRLPSGESLGDAIDRTDRESDGYASYFMINCAHPDHFHQVLEGSWVERVRGVRANASRRSHKELDESADLDAGNPAELGAAYVQLRERLPRLSVVGGCCGTDHRHVSAICAALGASRQAGRP
jgi:S-methylmethionine-dependent homocysteine/selenocysteine methylase